MRDDELNEMVGKDVERIRAISAQDEMDNSVPAVLELVFASLTALSAVVWLLSLLFVGGAIDGGQWMGMGALLAVLFGAPAGIIYLLRRGGAELVAETIEQISR